MAAVNKATATALKGYKKYIQAGHNSWGVVVFPTETWVYPRMTGENALKALGANVLTATRVNTEAPIKAWDKHISNLKTKGQKLNQKQYVKLFFKAP